MHKSILATLVFLALTACAQQKPKEAAQNDAGAPTGELTEEKIMAAQAQGFTIVNEDGQQMLCRREMPTGTRARYKTTCMTAREWEQLSDSSRQGVQDMARRRPPRQGT